VADLIGENVYSNWAYKHPGGRHLQAAAVTQGPQHAVTPLRCAHLACNRDAALQHAESAPAAPPEHLNLVNNEWEQAKKSFSGTSVHNSSQLQLPYSLVRSMPPAVQQELSKRSNGYEDKLRLTDEDMMSIFDPAVDKILQVSLTGQSLTGWSLTCKRGGWGSCMLV
jgi:hypothetical protein